MKKGDGVTLQRLMGTVVVAVVMGCQGPPTTQEMLKSAAGPERMRATVQLAHQRNWQNIPVFIGLLADEDVSVRMAAVGALVDQTGTDYGFHASGSEEERGQAIQRWRQWWEREGQAGAQARPRYPGTGEQ